MPPKKKQKINDDEEEEGHLYETKTGPRLSEEASKQNDVKDTHELTPHQTAIKEAFQDAKVDNVIIPVLQNIIVGYVGKEFISRWSVGEIVHPAWHNSPKSFTRSMEIQLPLVPGAHDFTVEWGDGKSNRITHSTQAEATHVYDAAGEYEVRMCGLIEGISFKHARRSTDNIVNISQWGDVKLGTDGNQFRDCRFLRVSATDAPNLNNVTSMAHMFQRARSLVNCDFSNWNTGNVTNMANMFYDAEVFNADVSRFDTSAVTDMQRMFLRAKAFNGDLSRWNTGNVTNMRNMFWEAVAFNGNLRAWDVTAVTDSQKMFASATSFNLVNKPVGLDVS